VSRPGTAIYLIKGWSETRQNVWHRSRQPRNELPLIPYPARYHSATSKLRVVNIALAILINTIVLQGLVLSSEQGDSSPTLIPYYCSCATLFVPTTPKPHMQHLKSIEQQRNGSKEGCQCVRDVLPLPFYFDSKLLQTTHFQL
jgi:hypothetical protein